MLHNIIIVGPSKIQKHFPYTKQFCFRLEFCNISSTEIKILYLILQKNNSITELNIIGNPNKSQNFYLLLRNTKLKSLSMRFCKINEDGIAKIAQEIKSPYGLPLTHLNLSSNFISDEGVLHIANSLRENRCLKYLNLADNHITDVGCITIMEVLQKFPLKQHELVCRRGRILAYYIKKREEVCLLNLATSLIFSIKNDTFISMFKNTLQQEYNFKKLKVIQCLLHKFL